MLSFSIISSVEYDQITLRFSLIYDLFELKHDPLIELVSGRFKVMSVNYY
jgi:hypothetical protein